MRSRTLHRVLAALLILMAITLVVTHFSHIGTLALAPTAQFAAAVVAGLGIGVVAALMGVAGGELLIPTIVVLFAVDIKIAGSLWLIVSLPTVTKLGQRGSAVSVNTSGSPAGNAWAWTSITGDPVGTVGLVRSDCQVTSRHCVVTKGRSGQRNPVGP
jgi:hypothetical protein